MTETKKPKGTLSLGKPKPDSDKRGAPRPVTSRKVNLERDRSKKPAPVFAEESPERPRPAKPGASSSRRPASAGRNEGEANASRRRKPGGEHGGKPQEAPHRRERGEAAHGGESHKPAYARERNAGGNRERPQGERPAYAGSRADEGKARRRTDGDQAHPRAESNQAHSPRHREKFTPRDSQPDRVEQFFATCPRGLENPLMEELLAIGAENLEKTSGGITFFGPMTVCYAANLHSRVATRILLRVSAGKYQNEEDIYQGALAVYWHKWFEVTRTISVKVVAQDSLLKSLNFITLKIKDAICDRFRAESGERPNVQNLHPDVRIHAFLTDNRYMLYLDTSGESLYKRGLRKQAGLAPINENLAAGILKLTGWKTDEPLYDPMCGSGTFLMEAAQMALNIAPGLGRDFAFERMLRMDFKAWKTMKADAQAACQPIRELPIYGSDVMGASLRDADSNLKAAGLREAVKLSKYDILDIDPPEESGVLVMNPPYGVRLGEEDELAAFYPKLGDVLKQRFANWRAYIISADPNLPKLIHLSASKKTPLFNGSLECRLLEYKLVEGSNRA